MKKITKKWLLEIGKVETKPDMFILGYMTNRVYSNDLMNYSIMIDKRTIISTDEVIWYLSIKDNFSINKDCFLEFEVKYIDQLKEICSGLFHLELISSTNTDSDR